MTHIVPNKFYLLQQYIAVFLIFGASGTLGSKCNTSLADLCLANFDHYESETFPFYGQSEKELDYTCRCMESSLNCMSSFSERCSEDKVCLADGYCRNAVTTMGALITLSGLTEFNEKLCKKGENKYRKIYLQNSKCIKDSEASYSYCRRLKHVSQEHIMTMSEPDTDHSIKCCFFSWYQACYINATMEKCSTDVTSVVTQALHFLTGTNMDGVCQGMEPCEVPPLPEDSTDLPELPSEDEKEPFTGCKELSLHHEHFSLKSPAKEKTSAVSKADRCTTLHWKLIFEYLIVPMAIATVFSA